MRMLRLPVFPGHMFKFSLRNRSNLSGKFLYRFFIPFLFIFLIEHGCMLMAQDAPGALYPILFNYAKNLYPEYRKIPEERRRVLENIADYIFGAVQIDKNATILFIGTNNATRSIMVEAWAHAAAQYYHIEDVHIYSGGTQVTQVSPFSIKALEDAGFIVYKISDNDNPRFAIKYSYNLKPVILFSKKFDNRDMPRLNYGAIFVCPNADLNVPFLKGMNFRSSMHFFDPSAYDNTPGQLEKYKERCHEIAVEVFYIFYCIKNKMY